MFHGGLRREEAYVSSEQIDRLRHRFASPRCPQPGAHAAYGPQPVRRNQSAAANREQASARVARSRSAGFAARCAWWLQPGTGCRRDFRCRHYCGPGRAHRLHRVQHRARFLRDGAFVRHPPEFPGDRRCTAGSTGKGHIIGLESTDAPCRGAQPERDCSVDQPWTRGSEMSTINQIEDLTKQEYKWGFVTEVEEDRLAKGLDENTIRAISAKKNEPEFMLEWRLKAFRYWASQEKSQAEPTWANVKYPAIDYQDIVYYSAPKKKPELKSLDEVDPEILRTYEKLGIPLLEQQRLAGVAVDAVFDSVSVATTFKDKLSKLGVIFCSFSEAVQNHPDLVKKYLGTVVPYTDNFFAALNAAVFSDGSFVYVPKGVRCPMELSTYFRINASETGQFERTLIVAEEGAYVSYLEGCTAPIRDENQLHAAVVELVALDNAQIKYSTVQNWYPGDKEGKGGIYNFVTKRGKCAGKNSKISWTQVETGSSITWKYPSCILQGDNSIGEFYSVALTNNRQQADTGTKMIHLGKNTRSTIVSKGISAGYGQNTYRGMVKIQKGATGARNYTQCDSLLIGDKCGAHTFPYIEVKNSTAHMEHEASTSKIGEDQLFYLQQRGLKLEDAVSMIINGFCKQVFRELPMEFAVEAQKLLGISLEGSVG